MSYKTLPIFMAFLIMGVADAMGPMGDAVKNQYQLSNVMATMLAFFVFIAFAVFSVPGGLLAARIGKKNLLLLGLGLNALAMLIPSIINPGFGLLLGCIFVLGIGTTFLQVAGNPIMRDVSKEGNYSRNLSFAQGIKGLGSTAATYLVTAIAAIALFKNMGWRGIFPIFCALMTIAFVWVLFLKVDEAKADVPPSIGSSLSLLKKPVFAMAVLGIFLYVGAESSMGRFLFPQMRAVFHEKYEVSATPEDVDAAIAAEMVLADAKDTVGEAGTADANEIALAQADLNKVDSDQLERAKTALAKATQYGAAMFFLLLTIGRIGGGFVLTKVKPRPAFRVSALMGVVGAGLLMTGNTSLAIGGVILGGLGFANIWPLLFSITVEEEPDRANELSGLMCMAISGGAIVPLIMGKFVDLNMGAMAFVVPAICFGYLLMLSLKGSPKTEAAA